MNKEILQEKLESLQGQYTLSHDYVEGMVISAQIELLETLIKACP